MLDPKQVNIYDTQTPDKQIVFSGTCREAANYLKVSSSSVDTALRKNHKIGGRYAVRIKSDKQK